MAPTDPLRVCLVLLAVVLGGCRTLNVPLGDRFVVTARERDQFRAVSADEAQVRVQDWKEQGGDLAFWAKALRRNLVEERGYVVISEQDTRDGRGQPGREFLFETTVRGRTVRYLLVLFVTHQRNDDESRIRVVEYVADKPLFDAYLPDVRRGIAGMTAD